MQLEITRGSQESPHSFKCCVNKTCQIILDAQSQTPVDSNDVLIETSTCAPVLLFETLNILEGLRGRDRMIVGFTTTYAISAYHH